MGIIHYILDLHMLFVSIIQDFYLYLQFFDAIKQIHANQCLLFKFVLTRSAQGPARNGCAEQIRTNLKTKQLNIPKDIKSFIAFRFLWTSDLLRVLRMVLDSKYALGIA